MTPPLLPATVGCLLAGRRHARRLFAPYGDIVPDCAPHVGRLVGLRSPHLIGPILRSPAMDATATGRVLARAVGTPSMLVALSGGLHRPLRTAVMSAVRDDVPAATSATLTVAAPRMADVCATGRPLRRVRRLRSLRRRLLPLNRSQGTTR
ncbi:hypothetical protein AB0D11_38790 [Streptomyces monashensis]|uniref:hypothetical protein n=1 Tax=Streptomyces monashensis TaxID=1678012 RepID=UPI0033EB6563